MLDWPGIRIRCPSCATCLHAGCCLIELAKCGVMWHREFRGKYLNVNVLGDTRKDRTDKLMLSHGNSLYGLCQVELKNNNFFIKIFFTEGCLSVRSNNLSDML